MSSLNDEQRAHVAYLGRQPLESLTWCGWYTLREGCPHPECAGRGSRADALLAACPWCMNEPWRSGRIVHRIGCPWEDFVSPYSDLPALGGRP